MPAAPKPDRRLPPAELARLLKDRRTINLYEPEAVPLSLLREAIDAAVWAPNHHLTEPWHFYLLGPETIARCIELVRDIVAETKSAERAASKAAQWARKPGWLVVTCRRSGDALREREDYAACSAAMQNLLLYLWSAGVGSKWTTGDITRDRRFFDIVGIDADAEFVVGLVWFGHPRVVPEQKRKPAAAVVTERP